MIHYRKCQISPNGHGVAATRMVAVAAIIGAAMVGVPALATSPSGFTPTLLSIGRFPPMNVNADKVQEQSDKWDLKLQTKGDTNVIVVDVAIAPGGYSGWHTHPGPSLVTVTAGEVVNYDGDNPLCTGHTLHTGDTFVDPGGLDHSHNLRNESASAAELVAVGLFPASAAGGLIDRPQPNNCGF